MKSKLESHSSSDIAMDKNAATVADGDDADMDDPLYLLVLYVDKGMSSVFI